LVNLKKEFYIFVGMFILISFGIHIDAWFSHPINHITLLTNHALPLHPLLYVSIVYIIIMIIRLILSGFRKIFNR